MMRRPITPADKSVPVKVVLFHAGQSPRRRRRWRARHARQGTAGLTLSLHAATDWADNPAALADCRQAILEGDIVMFSMIFVEDHVRAIADVLEARHRQCEPWCAACRPAPS